MAEVVGRANAALRRVDSALHVEAVALARIAAEFGTPVYVYSANTIRQRYAALQSAFAQLRPRVCYSVKANSNLSVLALLHDCGAAFDVVSGGELLRLRSISVDASKVVFAGCAKTDAELELALAAGVGLFNVESEQELVRIDAIARALGIRAGVSLRLNSDLEVATLPGITTVAKWSKFGMRPGFVVERSAAWSQLAGVHIVALQVHLGSQLSSPATYRGACESIVGSARELARSGIAVRKLSLGGGFGVPYFERDEDLYPDYEAFAREIAAVWSASEFELLVEPGRSLVASAGVLATRVVATKHAGATQGVFVDAAMNDLIRPALYGATHQIFADVSAADAAPSEQCNVYGPVCESTDTFATDVALPSGVAPGDLLAFGNAGAYGFVLASNYNSRPRPPKCWSMVRSSG